MFFSFIPVIIIISCYFSKVQCQFNDICGSNNGKRFYLEHGEVGSLAADYQNNGLLEKNRNTNSYNRCTVEFITCPSCIIEIQFRYLNISRNCGKASVYDTCGCDYVWIYEPPIEDASGEQFCGRFIQNNVSNLSYISQTRTVAFTFVYNYEYGHAFTLDYYTRRNRINIIGHPRIGRMNNASQYISSPFFPYLYPTDLSVEYAIECESLEPCRISVLFTDFLISESSIIEFFDWNGQRMYVISGNIFRPPAIISTGPSLVVRFYANGASDFGFKASYSFVSEDLDDLAFKPNIGCGGNVNNLGGGITMMDMVTEGTKLFDCVWIIKPAENFRHRKTHLYVKVVRFTDFAGTTELIIRQGVTSTQPSVEVLRHPMAHYSSSKPSEHVVPISQGFYISLRGVFTPESSLAIVYAAFNYKDCFGGSDFLCHNLRCISVLLNCDGFDHCGDESDESSSCSKDPKDRREYSKIPNFWFPKLDPYSDITTATYVFLTCTFGLIGIILAMALLLYRVNTRAQHQRQLQNHIETIHAILEEGAANVEEEIIVPDEPPGYEHPPEYDELLKLKYLENNEISSTQKRCSQYNITKFVGVTPTIPSLSLDSGAVENCPVAGTSKSCQTTPVKIPDSPPPAYDTVKISKSTERNGCEVVSSDATSRPGPSAQESSAEIAATLTFFTNEERHPKYFETVPKYSSQIFSDIKKGIRNCKSAAFLKHTKRKFSCSEKNLVRYFSDSELSSKSKTDCWAEASKFKKSFSTDDLSLL